VEQDRCVPRSGGDGVVPIVPVVDALVPVKAAADGKARLQCLLSPGQRQALVRAMLRDVVETLRAAPGLRSVAVTSPDAEMLTLAARYGAEPLLEPAGAGGLNGALTAAITQLHAAGAGAVLIVQGDVPEIGPDDVAALLDGIATRAALVRGVPSADGGTSALLLRPPDAVTPRFGPDSFRRHAAVARAAGVAFECCRRPALAVDIDRPEDVGRLLGSTRAPHTREALARAGVTERLAVDSG
jgi:2-phospho-L-lactate guanylyltransferase